ncbi:hypothetical protein TVAG_286320 [Trichomonas vaginalis G3]|uniref:Uncharacterized protein n=1 Tax=Trichomonas vaginalis (strain ATCC PRA-98 / G3) TaxID=412133 RepID=A2EPE6_TRIV3|nr:cyclin-like family [Trichomonas vaginalis G3]EAY05454.1 hypothetical protein TVAG_286320 [Trichomonas vaginalis G3]KAI5503568.1 cyclin-like family [Trichomonas vaginalis G3]|eukprot:XP_001317677.1 hypothetical protein [Trichomonas vaginalis G3]
MIPTSIPKEVLENILQVMVHMPGLYKDFNTPLCSSTMRYLLKFYEKTTPEKSDYFTSLVAAYNLSSKVNECVVPMRQIVNAIRDWFVKPQFAEAATELGCGDTKAEKFSETLTQNAVAREKDIIIALNFNFYLPNVQDIVIKNISRIMSWHYNIQTIDIHSFIFNDCSSTSEKIQNEILMLSDYYSIPLELIALTVTQITLEFYYENFSPGCRKWNSIIAPQIKQEDFDHALAEIRPYVLDSLAKKNIKPPLIPAVYVDFSPFSEYKSVPICPSVANQEPLCPPLPLFLLQRVLPPDNSIFHHHYADHQPLCPPFSAELMNFPPQPRFSTKSLEESRKQKRKRMDDDHRNFRDGRPRDLRHSYSSDRFREDYRPPSPYYDDRFGPRRRPPYDDRRDERRDDRRDDYYSRYDDRRPYPDERGFPYRCDDEFLPDDRHMDRRRHQQNSRRDYPPPPSYSSERKPHPSPMKERDRSPQRRPPPPPHSPKNRK